MGVPHPPFPAPTPPQTLPVRCPPPPIATPVTPAVPARAFVAPAPPPPHRVASSPAAPSSPPRTFQDKPLLEIEKKCFEQEHPNRDGYLCHGLELYVTHEPCVSCSMGILHSRMGKAVFATHMPRSGGLSSDDRPDGGGRGLGLFWRRELNWSLMAWEWERDGVPNLPPLDPITHV